MKFKDKFKPGDIICSDHFYNGLCMVVDYGNDNSWNGDFRYSCEDLVKEGQKWSAYEFDTMPNKPYNWRIATDDDIAKYLTRYLHISIGKIGTHFDVEYSDDGIILQHTLLDDERVYLEPQELLDLKRIIDERVG
jgi:hypothetical protein